MAEKRFEEVYDQGVLKRFSIIVDKETGVNYLCIDQSNGVAITPLLDSQGKIVINKHA